jgi:hypothetical protein
LLSSLNKNKVFKINIPIRENRKQENSAFPSWSLGMSKMEIENRKTG